VARRTAELSVRNEELLALNELAGSLTRSLDPEAILAGALEAVARFCRPRRAAASESVGRADGEPGRGEDGGPQLEAVAVAAITGNQLVTRPEGDGVLIGLPMATGAGPLGALGLRTSSAPGPEMTALLMAIGNQVGLALSTARLSDEGREMAVLEERARLAREIHDTLAQQLTGIVIQLEAAQALVSRDPDRSSRPWRRPRSWPARPSRRRGDRSGTSARPRSARPAGGRRRERGGAVPASHGDRGEATGRAHGAPPRSDRSRRSHSSASPSKHSPTLPLTAEPPVSPCGCATSATTSS